MKILRHLPAIDQLKIDQRFLELLNLNFASESILTEWLKEEVELIRSQILESKFTEQVEDRAGFTGLIFKSLNQKIEMIDQNNLRSVINATGIVLHTNLGRARLSEQAIKQISETAASYSSLEYNIETGKRGSRHDLVEAYFTKLTGAEAAMVVNNNAAAVYLVLKAMAKDKEVIVSRGELVEIGGSFRISEIMEESQAHLVDVGTTNKTHLRDYAKAITEETGLLMKVHKSNFKIIGFTDEVDTEDLFELSQANKIPIYEDLGSGTLFNFRDKRIGDEPSVQEKVAAGIDIISFSGDKLLGGPQAGVIVGKKEYIDAMKAHHLARVLRVDKFTLAGLEATLKSYVRGQEATEVPTIRDIVESKETVLERAQSFIEKVSVTESEFSFKINEGKSKIGGGTMPDVEIETYVVDVTHKKYSSTEIAEYLRRHALPVIVRVQNDTVILDFRTITKEEVNPLVEAFLNER